MSLFRKRFTCIEPGEWPERHGVARVLVEHPDHAYLASVEEMLVEAGYDVAVCTGANGGGQRCPLLEFGHCSLTEGADVVLTSTNLHDSRDLIDAHKRYTFAPVIIEATPAEQDEIAAVAGNAVFVRTPITPRGLLDAVHRAASQLRTSR